MSEDVMLVAQIRHAHGVRGEVKLLSLTTPPELIFTLPLQDASGKPFTLRRTGVQKDIFLCRIEGIDTRNAAEALKGHEFFTPRAALPPLAAHQTYCDALIGLRVESEAGEWIGTVARVVNYGASDILVILSETGELMLPYASQFFPEDAKEGVLLCRMPEYIGEKQDTLSQREREYKDNA